MAGLSPTQRTLKLLRDRGFTCAVTERWNPFAKIRQDLFGFIDIVALRGGKIIGVQCTSRDNIAARSKKIQDLVEAQDWSMAGGLIWIIGWGKVGARGERKKVQPRLVRLQYDRGGWYADELPL